MQRLALTTFAAAWQQPLTRKPLSLSTLVRYYSNVTKTADLIQPFTVQLIKNCSTLLGKQPTSCGVECRKKNLPAVQVEYFQ